MKKIILALLMTMTLIATSACGSGSDSDSSTSTAAASDASTSSVSSKEEWVKLGKSVTVEGVQYTISAYKLSSGNDLFKPESGKKYLYVDVTAKNTTAKDYPVSSEMLFKLSDKSGAEYKSSNRGLVALDDEKIGDQLDVTVGASKEVRGGLAYEVPEGTTGLILTVKGLTSGEEKVELN